LLADDNFDMREYVARLLSAKYEVISVSNGSLFRACIDYYPYLLVTNDYDGAGLEAVSVLRSNPLAVDLVLTDVMMPFLDGFGLLKEIRSRDETQTLPVIMLSARAGEEASAEGLAEGADDYLTKPFTARELLSRVASHLNMSRMRNDAARTELALRVKVRVHAHLDIELVCTVATTPMGCWLMPLSHR
jgi:DNA-binding response OmpR family regulator